MLILFKLVIYECGSIRNKKIFGIDGKFILEDKGYKELLSFY